jgi:hypothetical protein
VIKWEWEFDVDIVRGVLRDPETECEVDLVGYSTANIVNWSVLEKMVAGLTGIDREDLDFGSRITAEHFQSSGKYVLTWTWTT